MDIAYAVLSLLVGWCGTPWPIRWPIPIPPWPPEPEPICPICGNVISSLGGLVGGVLVTQVFPSEISFVSVAIGAFVISRIAGDIYTHFRRSETIKHN